MTAPRLGLLGATGAVGEEILRVLEGRRTPVAELLAFASPASEGTFVDFRGDELGVERVDARVVAGCDLVLSAAPGVLEPLLPELRERGTALVDVSGALELDTDVPLALPGRAVEGPWVAVPRGVVAGLAIALAPLHAESRLERVTVTTLEAAAGAGRRGLEELQGQTVRALSMMDGDAEPGGAFPQALAFDCLPLVGERVEADESFEERRLRQVLRRLLEAPGLALEVTRTRVPAFMGALASVHVRTAKPIPLPRAAELWRTAPAVRLLSDAELPTLRSAVAHEEVAVGRVRADGETGTLAFVIALDTLRRGAALGVVEAAEALLAS